MNKSNNAMVSLLLGLQELAGRENVDRFELFQAQQIRVARHQVRATRIKRGGKNAVVIRIPANVDD